jgi:hypothetical protein
LLSWYRSLIRARHASPALRTGSLRRISPADRSTPVLAFLREAPPGAGGERVLVVHNLSAAAAEAGPYYLPGAGAEPLLTSADLPAPTRGSAGWSVRLPAGATGIWRLR